MDNKLSLSEIPKLENDVKNIFKVLVPSFFKVLVPSLFMIASSAQAELAWVSTPFWRTRVQTEQRLKLQPVAKDLEKSCAQYRDLVFSGPGKSELSREEVNVLRSAPDGMAEQEFAAVFKINVPASLALIHQTIDASNVDGAESASADQLPFYTLSSSEIVPQLGPIGEAKLVVGAESLVRVSEALGLKPMKTVLGITRTTSINQ